MISLRKITFFALITLGSLLSFAEEIDMGDTAHIVCDGSVMDVVSDNSDVITARNGSNTGANQK